MKKLSGLTLTFILIFSCHSLMAQHPQIGQLQGINYQAVAIDEYGKQIVGMDVTGKPLYEKTIGVRFSILKGNAGAIEYEETHTALTDKYGLFSLVIGKGTVSANGQYSNLMDMPWIDADQWLKVEISTRNDGNYRLVSLQQFMAVPYSFYTDDIADDAITTWKVLDSTLVNQDLHTSSVDSRTILDSTIINEDIHTGAVDSRTVLDYTLLNEDIGAGSVDSRTILDSTIVNEDIRTGAVDSRAVLDYTLLNEDIGTGSVDTRTILDSTILNEDIRTGSVDTRTILDETILNEDIANGTIDLTTKVTGVLPVPNGGTGVPSSTDHGLLVGGGNGPIRSLPAASDLQIPVGVTASDPVLKVLSSGVGINITQTADSVIISSGIQGVNSQTAATVSPGTLQDGSTWNSGPLTIQGVALGNIVVGSLDGDLHGCMMTTYVSGNNQIRVAIFNGTGSTVNFNGTYTLKVLVVQ
ncbi:MAG: hypothetical protein RL213_419 [Bacteroidota bacterium]|jgi:hypothetical protein